MTDDSPHDAAQGAPAGGGDRGGDRGAGRTDDPPHATLVRRKRLHVSVVWVIPVLAALVALGIAIQRVLEEGPTITVEFSAAPGIEAGKTPLKYKHVTIGRVSAVQLTEDHSKVLITARITKREAGLIVADTHFWVVSPHIGLTGISGLSTLLSGNYIAVQPGTSPHSRREFTGLDEPPPITDQKGRRFILQTADLGSLEVGSPIYYKSLPVGEVEKYRLAANGTRLDITVFIRSPYDQYVHTETRFWNASGLDIALGKDGSIVDVRMVSLAALLSGGLSFDTPEFARETPVATTRAVFRLYRTRAVAMRQPPAYTRHFVLSFSEPVRGLSVGAPVTLMGLAVGEVTHIGFTYNPQTLAVHPLVYFNFYPEEAAVRFPTEQQAAVRRNTERDTRRQITMLRRLVEERGLRARLRTASLLTGQRYISFEFDPKAPRVKVDWARDPLELPVAPGEIEDLESKLESILDKVDRMPLTAIGRRTSTALATLNGTLREANVLLRHVDTSAVPRINKALGDLDRALDNANATLLAKDAPSQEALRQALEELANTARSLRALTDYLERHPEALIRGRVSEPEPAGARQ
jgi:paraquat-inducible protein B